MDKRDRTRNDVREAEGGRESEKKKRNGHKSECKCEPEGLRSTLRGDKRRRAMKKKGWR